MIRRERFDWLQSGKCLRIFSCRTNSDFVCQPIESLHVSRGRRQARAAPCLATVGKFVLQIHFTVATCFTLDFYPC